MCLLIIAYSKKVTIRTLIIFVFQEYLNINREINITSIIINISIYELNDLMMSHFPFFDLLLLIVLSLDLL